MADALPKVGIPLFAGVLLYLFNRAQPLLGYRVIFLVAVILYIASAVSVKRIRSVRYRPARGGDPPANPLRGARVRSAGESPALGRPECDPPADRRVDRRGRDPPANPLAWAVRCAIRRRIPLRVVVRDAIRRRIPAWAVRDTIRRRIAH